MRSEYYQWLEPHFDEDEAEHLKMIKAHRAATRGSKKDNCFACETKEEIQRAHIYPISQFAFLLKPGEIPTISLCKHHHKIFDYIAKLYLKGWNWKTTDDYLQLEGTAKERIFNLMSNLESKFIEIMGKSPIEYDPLVIQTGGKRRVIFKKP